MAESQRVLITGASRGLGAALAKELAQRGHALILTARTLEDLQAVAAACRALGSAPVQVLAMDLAELAALPARFKAAEELLGGVDVLINNAGFGAYKPLEQWSPQEIADCVAVNLTAPMLAARALVPGMMARGYGYVLNIASDLARRPLANMAPYAGAKHGLLGFSASLLREAKTCGVKVTTVLPGIIDSAFNGAAEGDKEETWALKTAPLAAQIADLLDLPPFMVVDEIAIHPMGQDF